MDRTRIAMAGELALPPELVSTQAASLRALARSLARDEHAADDAVQETWLRALTAPPEQREHAGGWLRRVVAGFVSKRRRAEARRGERERAYALERPEAASDAFTRAETLRAVVDAVLSLEEPYRETVLLRWFEGLPPRDIAVRQSTTVATVNSRLQRAHARLREGLSRRLDLDGRELRGALLVLFGAESTHAAVAASLSIVGMTMTTKLLSAAGLAAAILCALLWFDRRSVDPVPVVAGEPAPSATELESVAIDAPVAAAPTRVVAAPLASEPLEAIANAPEQAPFAFDVTFVVLDEQGVPRPRTSVWIGLDLERTAHLGETGWDGELHSTWRGHERTLELVLELRGGGVVEGALRRIVLQAGAPERIVIAADGAQDPPPEVGAAMVVLDTLDGEEPQVDFGFGLSVGEPEFKTDALGNAVILDPWLLNRRVTEAGDMSVHSRWAASIESATSLTLVRGRFLDATTATEDPRAGIRGVVVDETARPIPGALVRVLAEKGAVRTSARTDADGAFEIRGMPPGRALCFAGGGTQILQRIAIEDLQPEETRDLRIVCPTVILTPVRLVDRSGSPLSRWRIEACRLDRNGTFVDRVLLDDDGRGMMALPMTETVRLFAGPEDRSETPPLLLEPNFLADGRATELVVRDDLRRASYAIDAHAVAANGHAYVLMRLWRVDSGLGRPGRLSDIQAIEGSDSNRFILSAGGLLPGDYFIEYGSRGTPWKRIGPYRLGPGAELALGPFVLDEPAQVEVSASEPDSDTLLRATARRQGLRVQSPTLRGRVPSTLLFTAGDYELSVTLDAKSDRPRARTRELHVAQDERLKLELEPKR